MRFLFFLRKGKATVSKQFDFCLLSALIKHTHINARRRRTISSRFEIIMTTKEEDEDALLYGDVGDSDDEEKETIKKVQTTTTTTIDRNDDGNDDDDDADKKDEDVGDERNNKKKEEEEKDNNNEEEESKKSKSVYVANLTWWTSDKQIEQLASEFGCTKSIQFFTEKKNGKSKGCAIVEFTSSQSALLCAENLNKRAIDGKACVVTLAPVVTAPASGGIGGSTMMLSLIHI